MANFTGSAPGRQAVDRDSGGWRARNTSTICGACLSNGGYEAQHMPVRRGRLVRHVESAAQAVRRHGRVPVLVAAAEKNVRREQRQEHAPPPPAREPHPLHHRQEIRDAAGGQVPREGLLEPRAGVRHPPSPFHACHRLVPRRAHRRVLGDFQHGSASSNLSGRSIAAPPGPRTTSPRRGVASGRAGL